METHISDLYVKFDIVSEIQRFYISLELTEVKEDLLNNICSFNEAIIVFERTDNALKQIGWGRPNLPHLACSYVTISKRKQM